MAMKLTLNLASRSYLNRRALYAGYSVVGGVLLLLLVLLAVQGWQAWRQGQRLDVRLAELESAFRRQQDADDFTPEAQARLMAQITFGNEVVGKDSFRWTALLDSLEKVIPRGARVATIQPDHKDGSLRLSGVAENLPKLQVVLDNLIASPDFNDVYLLSQSRVGKGASEATSFSIIVRGAF